MPAGPFENTGNYRSGATWCPLVLQKGCSRPLWHPLVLQKPCSKPLWSPQVLQKACSRSLWSPQVLQKRLLQKGCSATLDSLPLYSAPLTPVHGHARVHTSIYIYIYILVLTRAYPCTVKWSRVKWNRVQWCPRQGFRAVISSSDFEQRLRAHRGFESSSSSIFEAEGLRSELEQHF